MLVPVLTLDFARRLERLVAPALNDGGDGARVAQIGETIAQRAVGGQPRNKVFCFTERDIPKLPEILAFYDELNLDPTFYIAPVSFTALMGEALHRQGFAAVEMEQVILYGSPQEPHQIELPITFERVDKGNLEVYLDVFADGFEWNPAWRGAAINGARAGFNFDAPQFLVRWEGEPAAVCGLGLRDRVCHLVGGAVLPRFRGRGIQLEMLRCRLGLASDFDCEFVMSGGSYGSTSFRNQIAAGMQIAYIELAWRRVN